jgi:hypothetical protein
MMRGTAYPAAAATSARASGYLVRASCTFSETWNISMSCVIARGPTVESGFAKVSISFGVASHSGA